jgi:hypothetical protein
MSDPAIGLCSNCSHCRVVPGGRSTFYMCQRSLTEPEYPKYPRLPMVSCRGYEPAPPKAGQKNAVS